MNNQKGQNSNLRSGHRFIFEFSFLLLALCVLVQPALVSANGENSGGKKATKTTGESSSDSSVTTGKRRDPFVVPSRVKLDPKKIKLPPKEAQPIPIPGLDMRLSEYRSQVRSASMTGRSAPDKISAFLIDELKVNGIFKNADGFGAFVSEGVSDKKLTFFIRPGMRAFDGVVKEIAPNGVRFVKQVKYDNGTVRQSEEFRALPNK